MTWLTWQRRNYNTQYSLESTSLISSSVVLAIFLWRDEVNRQIYGGSWLQLEKKGSVIFIYSCKWIAAVCFKAQCRLGCSVPMPLISLLTSASVGDAFSIFRVLWSCHSLCILGKSVKETSCFCSVSSLAYEVPACVIQAFDPFTRDIYH